ncbi:helix-turn-helix domain-containing protein [Natronobacterium texcoconense]|uniref:Predicted DNA binding protein, contains HTH domain n=1 Tax=Natronobacterium texcoconense TaxID=1095778 RepID=A0A1H1H1I5_NATTX|nr:helix-turn-helix domain-containing protein [Natronobacterium texcoconense]SDR19284.1 Predicted DNA binding protein, contains HTH domain [Natronobacterium texcoconense]
MLRSTVHIDLNTDYVLNEVTTSIGHPITITRGEVHRDGTLTFIAEVPDSRDEIALQMEESDVVDRVGTIGDNGLLVRKPSSGATPIICKHNGILFGINVFGTKRIIDVLTFSRADIRHMVQEFEELGQVNLGKITQVSNRPAGLSKRQQEIVEKALQEGYYDWPRETDAEELAAEFGITHPTLAEHLRKAEKKLIEQALHTSQGEIFEIPIE